MVVIGQSSTQGELSFCGHSSDGAGSPWKGVDGLTVPGYTGAIGGESSPIPFCGEPTSGVASSPATPDMPRKLPPNTHPLNYLDYEATSPANLSLSALQVFRRLCGSQCIVGEDDEGNGVVVRIPCRREWCSTCRDTAQRQRVASVLPRFFQIDVMGYLVTTFPMEVRLIMKDPRVLTLLAKRLRRLLRKLGHRKVYTRWHYFGDKSNVFNPHLNVLFDSEWLSPDQLTELKDLIRRKLLPRSIAKSIGKDLVIHYDYSQDPKRKMHWIKYVTRSTFTDSEWDEQLASRLYGFHNGCFAGFWDDPPKWRLTGADKKYNALLQVKQGIHPISSKPIVWNRRLVPWVLALTLNLTHLGAWCYCYTMPRPPPQTNLDLSNLIELPNGDYRKHPNAVRKAIETAMDCMSRLDDYESYS